MDVAQAIILILSIIFNLRQLVDVNFNVFVYAQQSKEMVYAFLTNDTNKIQEFVEKAGDPVLIPSGMYIEDEEDIEIPDGAFAISRRYVSESNVRGHIGEAWITSLDSRIIRGITKIDMNQVQNPASQASAMSAISDFMFLDEAKEMAAEYNAAVAQYNQIMAVANRAAALHALNQYVLFPGSPSYYEEVGNESLLLIDENGSPTYFAGDGEGGWKPQSGDKKLKWRLVSIGNRGADAPEGFLLYCPAGIKKYYDTTGFLIKIEDQNTQTVIIARDDAGKVTKISAPHGNEWTVSYSETLTSKISGPEGQTVLYGYSGNQLVSVTDVDGDTVRYTYEDGRLKRIVKPDSSYIELTYGYDGADGAKLVSATRHEEGAAERFDYYPGQRLTVHTNHSGVVTKYLYDENQRTTREDSGDGTVKIYLYNESGLLSGETVNGDGTGYQYDSRGNVSVKQYSDGTREEWTWNGNDRKTRHTDRDGVTTEWSYDGKGNCVQIRQGGQAVFAASYNDRGLLAASRQGTRETYTYTHDSRGYIASRTLSAAGQTVTENWKNDALGRVTEYTDGAGRKWGYTWNRKTTVERTPSGLERVHTYDSRKDVTGIRERDTLSGEVREQSVVYDRRHLALRVTDGAGKIIEYGYRDDGLVIQKKQGAWIEDYAYDAAGRLAGITRRTEGGTESSVETYGYTLSGAEERLSVTSPAGTMLYQYDRWGRITGVTNALGENSRRVLSGAGRVLKEQGASGGNFAYSYDALGRLTGAGRENDTAVRVVYNTDGTVAEKIDRNGARTVYGYDGRGLLIKETGALGEKNYRYDGAGRVVYREIKNAGIFSISGAEKYYTAWEYDDSLRTVKVSEGGLYSEIWHLNAWEEAVKRQDGEGGERRWRYDGAGNLAASADGYGRETLYTYNAIGKAESVTYPDGNAATYEYNHLGKAAKITDGEGVLWQGGYDADGRLTWEKGRPGIDKEYRYDAPGRVTEVRSGGEVTERYTYGSRGRSMTFTGAEGGTFTVEKNGYAEVERETNRLGDVQSYAYDEEGRRISAIGYSGKRISAVYDDSNGATVTEYADGTVTRLTRDFGGKIIRAEGATGIIDYRYNAAGKLIRQQDEGSGETTNYEYDKAGRRARMLSGNRDVRYWYGSNSELTRVFDNTQRLSVEYTYNETGRETRRVYGNGVTQETFYDRAGRTVLITEWAPSGAGSGRNILRAEGYVYDEAGRRAYNVDEVGNITKYEYDNQSRLSAVLYPHTEEKAAAAKKEAELAGLNFSSGKGSPEFYSFTSAEVAKLRDILNTVSYGRGNLIQYNRHLWRETYTYDGNGNRLAKTTPWGIIRYTYDAENRLLTQGSIAYTYDRDGNLLSERGLRRTAKYEYGGQNRMAYSEVTDLAGRHTVQTGYEYDAFGRRTIAQDAGSEAMRTLYDGFSFETIRESAVFRDGSFSTNYAPAGTALPSVPNHTEGERYRHITEEAEAANNGVRYRQPGSAPRRYTGVNVTLYGRGEAVAVNYTASGGGRSGFAYMGKDILGSVRSVTSGNAGLEDRYEYDAFGTPYKGDSESGMNLGYTGKPYNSTTGMYDYGYRDYKPEVARFTTIDPIRDGANWFSYVNNDPVNYTDPWGLSARDKTGFKGVLKNILGKINAAPVTVAGLVAGAVLTGVSVITGNGGKISIENNAITFTAGLGLPGSITLGNTIIHAKGSIENWNSKTISKRYDGLAGILLGRHEEEHTYQYETYGVLMPIMWGITIIQNGKMGKSPFEIAADNASEIPGTRK